MLYRSGQPTLVPVMLGLLLIGPSPLRANVDIALRPATQMVSLDDEVEIGLYLVSDDGTDQTVGSLEIILLWSPSRLELLRKMDNGPYPWMSSGFPDDSGLDGLNAPFGGSVPDNDGDAYYVAVAPFAPYPPAMATPDGLLVTTFVFRAMTPGATQVEIASSFGAYTHTTVYDGEVAGLDVTGAILDPVSITVRCDPPAVSPAGARYLEATPVVFGVATALIVTGDPSDTAVSCVSEYLQPDGTLGPTPVFLPADQWGTVLIRDAKIRPGTRYFVEAACDLGTETVPSAAANARTWRWGDADNSGNIDLDDILLVLDGFQGIFVWATLENVDFRPCLPDRAVDLDDVLSVLDAFMGLAYPASCPPPCP